MAYSIHEVSSMFHVPSHTLRYYEQEGLLPAIERSENGRRGLPGCGFVENPHDFMHAGSGDVPRFDQIV
ncbi:hypothetical protein HMSSN139_27150 [Paenibacillus sp. HMSSN-139]|nr:hypothetical protein HMSSN139_27150 [Paenibacillus sp. HMSSN-139]